MPRPTLDDTRASLLAAGERLVRARARQRSAAVDGALGHLKAGDVAREAGLSKGMIYHLWPSQEEYRRDLLLHLARATTTESYVATEAPDVVATYADADDAIGWDDLATAAERATETVEQLKQTRRTAPPAEVVDLAREIAAKHTNSCDAALEISTAIGDAVQYMQGVTGVHSTAAEAWAVRKGVCQDIAHLALGALRSVGIPARYVSGYLHPKPSAGIGETVAGESHAWVEWFCGGEWRGFDPTNLIDIGDRHVLVGRGRDYNDVPPLRGVYAGPFGSTLFVTVEITREA